MEKIEIWKEIPGFSNYEASTEGRIRSKSGHIIYTCKNNCDYEICCLYKNNKPYCRPVHRLVAQTFIPNPYNLTDVDHINNNKSDNSIDNLCWLSHKDNCRKYFNEKKYKSRLLLSVALGNWINIYSGKTTSFQGTYTTPANTTIDYYCLNSNLITEMKRLSSTFPDYIFSVHTDGGELFIQGTRRIK